MTRARCGCAIGLVLGMMCMSGGAAAQETATPPAPLACPALPAPADQGKPSLLKPFTYYFGDLARVPTRGNLDWAIVGMGTAITAQRMDATLLRTWAKTPRAPFQAGAFVGATPIQLGTAFAVYSIGRATNKPRAMALGGDLIRAQLVAETMTIGLKIAVRRDRPEGTGYSFPSGHAAISFASASVVGRHFGWKGAIPAYAVATYVAASRVQTRRHYLSDVAFGAAVGIISGRAVTIGRGKQLVLTPIAAPSGSGGGLGLTLLK